MKSKIGTKKTKVLIILGILIISLVAIGVLANVFMREKPKENIDESEKIPEVIEPPKKVNVVDLDSDTRPFAIMINNNSAVWKYQSGLNEAYVVYEMLVEGGITREMALYKDADVEKIQSIRSARHYFLDYVLENDAIYVHWGWSPQAQSDIKSLKINNINGLTYENKYFFRDKTVKAAYEHRGYTKMSSLNEAVTNLKYRGTTQNDVLLNYSADTLDLGSIEEAQEAKYVAVKFSSGHTTKFIYDEVNKVYTKKQNNTEMKDFTSQEKFTTKNIIVYQVGYSLISGDTAGRLNMSNIGSGEGYYISEGKAVPITWEKSSRSNKTIYKYKNGEELIVNDGNTYIELQPKNQNLTISDTIPA